ncbi:non-ribosomal peptide synthetase [Pseudoalteromonas denitrificans]|uniref:Amino acid adenylation domain-containing protein n=1 Tax=Pseudoalteromonas denitrificans DSM 6059 TaxID=1123010 RepID=A0A1I1UPV6_9GAMM|nr:non-ribosomal peptide synthetase [Pseudoalteromonas denitrificans]SFD72769.1 amino acid adenylation domain-containing protein [Pseudoalteromonas denitrificans DSM 6059]
MSIELLFEQLQQAGVIFEKDTDNVKLKLPRNLDKELKAKLINNKEELKDYLKQLYKVGNKNLSITKILRDSSNQSALSFSQQRLWFIDQLQGGTAEYNMPMSFNVEGKLDIKVVEAVLTEIIQRHEILRTVYQSSDTEVLQKIQENFCFHLSVNDLSEQSEEIQKVNLKSLVTSDRQTPFNLQSDLMVRASYILLSHADKSSDQKQKGVLLFNMHHIASDGWSMEVLTKEFFILYQAFVKGKESPLMPLEIQYLDYAHWQRECLQKEELTSQLNYWQEQLKDVPPIHNLQLDKTRPQVKKFAGNIVSTELPQHIAVNLISLAKHYHLTPFMLLHAALAIVLSRNANTNDVVIGTPIANRLQAELEPLIGFFVNTLVLRVDTHYQYLEEYFLHVRQVHLNAQSNQDVPFEQLVERLNIPRSTAHGPLFQIALTTNTDYGLNSIQEVDSFKLPDVTLTPYSSDSIAAKFDLNIDMSISEHGLGIDWTYDIALFDHAHIEKLNNHLSNLLENIASQFQIIQQSPQVKPELNSLAVLSESEISHLLTDLNNTNVDYESELCIHTLFEQQAQSNPDSIALVFDDKELTYKQLNEKANQVAYYLIENHQVKPDTLVGICIERSLEMVIGILGILKAGGAYVPMDPDYPNARLEYMCEDAQLELVLTRSGLQEKLLFAGNTTLYLDGLGDINPTFSTPFSVYPIKNIDKELSGINGNHLAYVIYTSGSTGQPKGVMIEHQGLINTILDNAKQFNVDRDSIFYQSTSFGFDAASWIIWITLVSSGELVLSSTLDFQGELETVRTRPITHIMMTPSILNTLDNKKLKYIKAVIVGGEYCEPGIADKWLMNASFYNAYGPTEASICCTIKKVSHSKDISIGKAISNIQLLVLGEGGNMLPYGSVGELHIGGVGLSRGYLNRPNLTAAQFIDNPYYDSKQLNSSKRLYKTGDLVKYLPNGDLKFIGRIDDQVKIRGFRVELGEIEQHISQLAMIDSTLVLVKETANDSKQLVAYIKFIPTLDMDQAENTEHTLIAMIKTNLSASLPEHMLPTAFIIMNEWPLTPNGKIDKKSLPDPKLSLLQTEYIAAKTQTEKALVGIWSDLLNIEVDNISINANFFELGGHSLLMMQLVTSIKKLGYHTNVQKLFSTAILQDMAKQISADQGEVSGFSVPENLIPANCDFITPEMLPLVSLTPQQLDKVCDKISGGAKNIQDIYPLAPLQEGVLFVHTMSEKRDPYVTTISFEFDNAEDFKYFESSLNLIIQRHDVLRTAILWRDHQPALQVVQKEVTLQVEYLSFEQYSNTRKAFLEFVDSGEHYIDLENAPLMQLQVVNEKHGQGIYVLLKFHHLLIDHVSLEVIMEELAIINKGEVNSLPEPILYREFLARTLDQAAQLDIEAFFTHQIGTVEEPSLAFGLSDVTKDGGNINQLHVDISDDTAEKIRLLMRKQQSSPAAFFHAAWAMVLAACTGHNDVVFGTVLSGRMNGDLGIERMLGMMINTLPIRVTLGNADVKQIIKDVNEALSSLIPYEQVSLAQAQRCSGVNGQVPLFNSMLNYRHSVEQTDADSKFNLIGLKERTNYPFTLGVNDFGKSFSLDFQVDEHIDITRISDYMQTALSVLLAELELNSTTPISKLSVLPEHERFQQMVQWNDTEVDYPQDKLIHEFFEAQVRLIPNNIAVVFEKKQLTYKELNEASNRLAHYLKAEGVTAETLVGICVERSLEMVIGILAILKAGGAYVPMDPNYPKERLEYILADTGIKHLLTQSKLNTVPELTKNIDVSELDSLIFQDKIQAYPETNIQHNYNQSSSNLAYVIYTSGSTGNPKGVMMEHQGLVNRIDWMQNAYNLTESDHVLQKTPYCFDVSVWEFVWTLGHGARLVMAKPEGHKDPDYLKKLMYQEKVSVMHFVPSMLNVYLAAPMSEFPASVRYVFCSGEALEIAEVKAMRTCAPHVGLHNLYGPTEAAIDVSYFDCNTLKDQSSVPIGKPIQNIELLILDKNFNCCPIGTQGELYIGGAGLARGYLNQPSLTKSHFITNPFSDDTSARLYRTGDLVRYLADGNIEYIGRSDNQVKIRGFRIELGEIEQVLLTLNEVNSALVMARKSGSGNASLIAYVVLNQPISDLEDDMRSILRGHLIASLPIHMVPSAFVVLDQWPLTANGKVDRKSLPEPELSAMSGKYIAPTGDIEITLSTIWANLLKSEVSQISAQANFFEIGGHSLLLVRLMAEINDQFAIELSMHTLFENLNFKSLASLIHSEVVIKSVASQQSDAKITSEGCL